MHSSKFLQLAAFRLLWEPKFSIPSYCHKGPPPFFPNDTNNNITFNQLPFCNFGTFLYVPNHISLNSPPLFLPGLEPMTYWSCVWCSTPELYPPNLDRFEDPHIQQWHVRASKVFQVGWIAVDHHMIASGTCKSHIHTHWHAWMHTQI